MNIIELLNKNSKQPKQKTSAFSEKNKYIKVYNNILKKLIKHGWIDMLEYTHLSKLGLQQGFTLVNMERYIQIINNIMTNTNINKRIKTRFLNVCKRLFSHLHKLIKSDTTIIKKKDICLDIISSDIQLTIPLVFTTDQLSAIHKICQFLFNHKINTFGLYGYAGTGKTTIIIKLMNYLLLNHYIKSVVFAAPTNKAVNIMKSKFKNDIDDLLKGFISQTEYSNIGLENQLDLLKDKGIKIDFLTIHKLLQYKNDYNVDGNRIFVKGKKNLINKYDIVIIDECSMIQLQIIVHLFNEVRSYNRKTSGIKVCIPLRVPKLLFVGDPAQLPPVREKNSIIFSNKKKDFDIKAIVNILKQSNSSYNTNITLSAKNIIDDIINQKSITMKTVVRSNNNKVVGLCNNIRSWVFNDIKSPILFEYKGSKVRFYDHKKGIKKIHSKWFKKCVRELKKSNNFSIVILAWTNKMCNLYNDTVRQILFNKKQINKYEVGDILILNDFYNFQDKKDVYEKQRNKEYKKTGFYTSEQIKVVEIEKIIKVCNNISVTLQNTNKKVKNFSSIKEYLKKSLIVINKNIYKKYHVWKLYVQKMNNESTKINTIPKTYQIYVIKDISIPQLEEDKQYVSTKIKNLRRYYNTLYKDQINFIDCNIIRPLWRSYNTSLVDPFANVNYGISLTCHSSQASTYYNVYVDSDDILNNKNDNDAKRCLYTAITRTSGCVNILV
uniref:UvrD-family helicase n=1 Tax=Mimivirus LCMiAC02 TaxID=2506609 RepID=A0A481Z209_9VIRU|nr:MAG: UvrD-family helicase [Mimivirus LCMiAC02]